jgi:uncharacterized protein YjdB
MRADQREAANRRGKRLHTPAAVAMATLLLFACSACNGFFVDPTLTSIALTPVGATILVGGTTQYRAVGTYNDGSTKSLSPAWFSSSSATATISSSGLAKGIAAGTATITATSGGVTGTTTVTVQTAPLQSITVTPANPSISLTTVTQQFTATGHNTDGSTNDLTSSVTWTSGAPTVATINNSGLATAVKTGSSIIQATSGSISGSTTLTVVQ